MSSSDNNKCSAAAQISSPFCFCAENLGELLRIRRSCVFGNTLLQYFNTPARRTIVGNIRFCTTIAVSVSVSVRFVRFLLPCSGKFNENSLGSLQKLPKKRKRRSSEKENRKRVAILALTNAGWLRSARDFLCCCIFIQI